MVSVYNNVIRRPMNVHNMWTAGFLEKEKDLEPTVEWIFVYMIQFMAYVCLILYWDFQVKTADELNELHFMILKDFP